MPSPPKKLDPWHRAMLRRILEGARGIDLAKEFGVTNLTISTVKNSELGKEYIAELERRADEYFCRGLGSLAIVERMKRVAR